MYSGVEFFSEIRKQISENVNKKVQRKEFTCHFADLHELLLSKELEREFAQVVNIHVTNLEEHHYHAITEIVLALNSHILKVIVGERIPSSSVSEHERDIRAMSDEGKGKVRYCGAWAIAKVQHGCREYFKANIHSTDPNVRLKGKSEYGKLQLLSQLTWTSSTAEQNSKYKETLNVTLSRKYDKGSLVHISDDMFEWVLDLEQMRVNLLNSKSMSLHQDDLVENALTSILSNNQLLEKWKGMFDENECFVSPEDVTSLASQLFTAVVTRYIKMGVGEYLREFRREFHLQKTEAHRKKVAEKKKKNDLVSSKVTITLIRGDTSANKRNSHQRLQAMVSQQGQIFQTSVYNKGEVQLLCKAYGVSFRRSDSKAKLSEKLVPQIQGTQQFLHLAAFEESDDGQQPGPTRSAEVPPQQGKVIYIIFQSLFSTSSLSSKLLKDIVLM